MLNGSGGVAERLDYLPFGEEIPQGIDSRSSAYPTGVYPSTPDQVEAKFTDKLRDAESGLDFFGARYYSGPEGRFVTPDWTSEPSAIPYGELVNPQTLNLYGYVQNNPISRFDTDGHETQGETRDGRNVAGVE